jgi:predicted CXXCH cytochrome family protein
MRMTCPGKIWFGIVAAAGVLLMNQCSPYAGKSILHLFFDGVPEADSAAIVPPETMGAEADSSGFRETLAATSETLHYLHYPYEERDCGACHDQQSLGNLVEPQPGLCYTCHEDLSARYNYLHGPVAGGYCTACHDPHSSVNNHFLRITGDPLCFYCHKRESVLENEMHQGLEGMVCSDCHNPHGGEDKYIFQ